ncbi:hypothetical protein HQ487_03655 [Candidatus Uhrbacteria bacterium]|nr:hypothetical protein [Candidatus Uhrbacteria bacterium]
MARVEKNAALEKQVSDVKGDVVAEVRRRRNPSSIGMKIGLLLLTIFLSLLLFGAWNIAKMGIVVVPVLSKYAYEVPYPTRVVEPGVSAETILQETFTTTLTRRLYEGGGVLNDRSIQVALTEASLTTSLRSWIEGHSTGMIDVSRAQAVIDPVVGIEIFTPLDGSKQQTAVTIQFSATSQDGLLVLTPEQVFVGSLEIPHLFLRTFLPFFEQELARVNAVMVGYAKISSIEVLSGELVVDGELVVEIEGQ